MGLVGYSGALTAASPPDVAPGPHSLGTVNDSSQFRYASFLCRLRKYWSREKFKDTMIKHLEKLSFVNAKIPLEFSIKYQKSANLYYRMKGGKDVHSCGPQCVCKQIFYYVLKEESNRRKRLRFEREEIKQLQPINNISHKYPKLSKHNG